MTNNERRRDPESDAGSGHTLREGVPVIAMGGSAGALGAFRTFLEAMPPDSGAAFVLIQHLAPAHKSLLSELLGQYTRMCVVEVEDGIPVAPNHVYVIPPNYYLGIREGILNLSTPVLEHGIRMPIDCFLRSLAEDRQERAICILFSGAGSDGSLGVRAIRAAGGLTIAQDQTAQFGDMPSSAVATGLVDLVLPPERMPQAIMDYIRHPYVHDTGAVSDPEAAGRREGNGFGAILDLVQTQSGCDFRCYKKATILRRIERRMGLKHLTAMEDYAGLLRRDADEILQLRRDLLINVTNFFRDAEVFENLRLKVIRPMLESRMTDESVRVWLPGCSSGEEAYSVAMLLLEERAAAGKHCPVHLFATDIDEESLQVAREGVYPASIATDVDAARLEKFFVRQEQGYRIRESLRSVVVIASQNLITDPPFSKMDLVCCRNLLIYLEPETQAKLIPLFNFALNPDGYLLLGKSESICGRPDLFDTVGKKARIFRRIAPARPITLDTPIIPGRRPTAGGGIAISRTPEASYAEAVRLALLGHFAASVVLIDRRGQILQFHGQTSRYLNMPTGAPDLNLLSTAREGLSLKLRVAIGQALDEKRPVVLDAVPLRESPPASADTPVDVVRITVVPVARREADPLLAVIFEDFPRSALTAALAATAMAKEHGEAGAVMRLEGELRMTQRDLQSSIQDMEASNEELRVANEEVVSSNEELQSTVEELETSKEELQSVNEELTTVNSQLQEKVLKLEKANDDIANFIESTQLATIFLDPELRIQRFTPATKRLLKLIPADTGRPLSDLSLHFVGYDLASDVRDVAQGGAVVERDVLHADGSAYLVRVLPYRTRDNELEGAVVTFEDVTRLRQAEMQSRRLATVASDSNDALILFDTEGAIQEWNHGARELYGWSEAEARQMNIRDMTPPEAAEDLDNLIRQLLTGAPVSSSETRRRTKDGRVLEVWLTTTAVCDESGQIAGVATTERDVTERKRTAEALAQLNARLEQRVKEQTAEILAGYEATKAERQRLYNVLETLPVYVALLSRDYHVTFANKYFREHFGESDSQRCFEYLYQRDAPCENCEAFKVLETGLPHQWFCTGPDGRDYDVYNFPFTDADGTTRVLEMGIDITETRKAQAELKRANETLEQRVAERTAELTAANDDLTRLNRAMVGRELRMIELKQEVNAALAQAGLPAVYRISQ